MNSMMSSVRFTFLRQEIKLFNLDKSISLHFYYKELRNLLDVLIVCVLLISITIHHTFLCPI
jgi:hypothetical protein